MRRRFVGSLLAATVLVVMAGTPASAHGSTFNVLMSGAEEVPGPGDANGHGTAQLHIKPGQGTVCFRIDVHNIRLPATGAHIHAGADGVAGPVVVGLTPPGSDGTSSGCITGLDHALLHDIVHNPSAYYVNIHNQKYPDGAIRGQLP